MRGTLEAPQEPEDPASQGRLCLPPVHSGVVRPQAQPVAAAEGGHLLAEEEEKRVEAERGAHGPDVGQVHGGFHLHTGRGGGEREGPVRLRKPRPRGRGATTGPRRPSLCSSYLQYHLPCGPQLASGPPSSVEPPERANGSLKADRLCCFLALE